MDVESLKGWAGRSAVEEEVVSDVLTARLAALLDHEAENSAWPIGKSLPYGWHLTLFGTTAAQSTLQPDGHGPKGMLLPPIEWPYRMFAGRRVEFHGALSVGDTVSRVSRVSAIDLKQARSGPVCFVTVRHEYSARGALVVIEEQDIAYRPEKIVRSAQQSHRGAPPVIPRWSRSFLPKTSHLFRFSALTNNAHRIHYDLDYTRDVEGFPNLVVNGSLPVLFLWEFALQEIGRPLKRSTMRNVTPMFVDRPLALNLGELEDGKCEAWVSNEQGLETVKGVLEWA